MSKNMYKLSRKNYGKCPHSNETLATMIQRGDNMAICWLLSQNEAYLEDIARKVCSGEHELERIGDDLKQIGRWH